MHLHGVYLKASVSAGGEPIPHMWEIFHVRRCDLYGEMGLEEAVGDKVLGQKRRSAASSLGRNRRSETKGSSRKR